MLNTSLAVHY